jgi:CheY-like chemotaxis protein
MPRKAGVLDIIHYGNDGEKARDFLLGQNGYQNPLSARRPRLVLLDLGLPGTDGLEVFEQIKAEASLAAIPVIVLTNSENPHDIQKCYEAGANSYIRKPMDIGEFADTIQKLKEYWLETVILPDARVASG